MPVDFAVDAHGGRDVTSAEARRLFEREASVVGDFADVDAEEALERREKRFVLVDATDDRVAHLDGVFGARHRRQACVEGQTVVDQRDLQRQFLRHVVGGRLGHIVALEEVLHVEQDADDLRRVVGMSLKHAVDLLARREFETLGVGVHGSISFSWENILSLLSLYRKNGFIQEKGVHEYVSPSVCAIMSAISSV